MVGEFDLAVAGVLASTLAWLLELCPARLPVDVTGIRFVDCSGVDPLLRAWRTAIERGGAVELVGDSPALARLLPGVHRADLPEALRGVRGMRRSSEAWAPRT